MTTRSKLIKILQKAFPGMECRLSEDFDGTKDAIWTGEDAPPIKEMAMFNYYSYDTDPNETIWVMGVHRELWDILAENNWYAEFNDPGTVLLFNNGR